MHRFIPAPGETTKQPVNPEHVVAVKKWAREILGLSEDVAVTLHETACVDPDCPLLESVITVFEGPGKTRTWRFTRPRVALTKLMVIQTLATPPETGLARG